MNLPNLLTLARIFLVPLLVAALLADGSSVNWDQWVPLSREIFALCVFLAAAATDLLDGYLARRLASHDSWHSA
jgi:phosphatidylglycerophosphate synthase